MSDALKSGNTFTHRIATAAEFTSDNPVLALSEFGFESDTGAYKIGDGVTAWVDASYTGSAAPTAIGAACTDLPTAVALVNQIRAILIARGEAV